MHFVDAIELIGRVPGHQISHSGRSAASQTSSHASFTCQFVKFKLSRRVEETAEIQIVHLSRYRSANNIHAEVIGSAVGDDVKAAQFLSQSNFIAGVSLHGAHSPST